MQSAKHVKFQLKPNKCSRNHFVSLLFYVYNLVKMWIMNPWCGVSLHLFVSLSSDFLSER